MSPQLSQSTALWRHSPANPPGDWEKDHGKCHRDVFLADPFSWPIWLMIWLTMMLSASFSESTPGFTVWICTSLGNYAKHLTEGHQIDDFREWESWWNTFNTLTVWRSYPITFFNPNIIGISGGFTQCGALGTPDHPRERKQQAQTNPRLIERGNWQSTISRWFSRKKNRESLYFYWISHCHVWLPEDMKP